MSIPSFMLKKLYVKGSLKNTDDGFEFVLKNTLAPGSIIGIAPGSIDDVVYPPESVTISTPKGTLRGDEINSRNPVTLAMNLEAKVSVKGQPLTPGEHHVVLSVLTREVGRIDIDLTDAI